MMGTIRIVGLGPSTAELITQKTWQILQQAEHLYLRTARHPAVQQLIESGIKFTSYDSFYDKDQSFEKVYQDICADLIEKAEQHGEVVYAVPGSPMVAERTVVLLRENTDEDTKVKIYPGMSFLDLIYTQLGIDPIDGLFITDAFSFNNRVENIDLSSGMIITQLYDCHTASDVKLTLMDMLSDTYHVTLLYRLGLSEEKIVELPLYELDRQKEIDYLTSLYVPAVPEKQKTFTISPLEDVIARLRAPDGCPWDIVQTHKSLRQNLIEEVYEVIEAIDLKDPKLLCEELGDLLMQIIFHARMAEESGLFSMQDVIDGISKKLIYRHPHVFGDVSVKDAGEVLLNWEELKKQEKPERKSVLDGVPKDLPALLSADKLQKKAANVGFDWPSRDFIWERLAEKIDELKKAIEISYAEEINNKLGDILFIVVSIARFSKVNAELSLVEANRKFHSRFSYVEKALQKEHKKWKEIDLSRLCALWKTAVKDEKKAAAHSKKDL